MYAELQCRSNFSFLRGASPPEKLVERAHELGYSALALTDQDGVYGMVRAHEAAKRIGMKLIVGSHLTVQDEKGVQGVSLVLLVMNQEGYRNLSALLTVGRRSSPKGQSSVQFSQIEERNEGLLALYVGEPNETELRRWIPVFADRLYATASKHLIPGESRRNHEMAQVASRVGVPMLVVGDVHAAERKDKEVQDVLLCIRKGVTIAEAGTLLASNGERSLRTRDELSKLFRETPEWLEETCHAAQRCTFTLDELHYSFPIRVVPEGDTPQSFLRLKVFEGAAERYAGEIPEPVLAQLEHELGLIATLGFQGYFLTVWDIVQFARGRGILCQGRGSAANSAVCYVLGITSIDPVRLNLLFERFISVERGEPPDIDVDFEHERREEVLQYVYERYGREHASMVCEVICYRSRSALREVGKVLGFSVEEVTRLSRAMGRLPLGEINEDRVREIGLQASVRQIEMIIRLAQQLRGFPRHLGIHSGGFVITRGPLTDLVPVENATMPGRTVVQWDKSDLESLGILKIDLLSLGILTCLRKGFALAWEEEGIPLSLETLPLEDPAVYDEISEGDTIGVFQIESRAQMTMLPRLRPRSFYDLVVEIALIRPGPIQGDMVHPYLRRRQGQEEVSFPHPAVERILGKTYGVPLFQEQVMRLAIAAGGFTPGEADQLRRAMGAWRKRGEMEELSQRLIRGLVDNGIEPDYARRIFEQIQGFGEYGFPESHAASFAVLVYASAYLRRHHRAAFTAALLNSQPMGFYSPSTLVQDARLHGVPILPIDIHKSSWDCSLERVKSTDPRREGPPPLALRLGFRLIRGLRREVAESVERVRAEAPLLGVVDLMLRGRLHRSSLLRLGASGAFRSMGLGRRESLWGIQGLPVLASPLLAPTLEMDDPWEGLPPLTECDELLEEYATTGVSVESHPMALIREALSRENFPTAKETRDLPTGKHVQVAGMVITRQRPSTASGVLFVTLEDETGHLNVIVWPKVYERFKQVARDEVMLVVRGKIERQGPVVHLIAQHLRALRALESPVGVRQRNFR